MRAVVRAAAAAALCCTLATQPGCTCIIDPCPVLIQRTYDWNWSGRVAVVDVHDVSRLTLTTNDRVMLVDADDRSGLVLTELVDASVGQQLEGGGRVVALFPGSYTLDNEATPMTQLLLVRLASSMAQVEAVAEWDIEGCAETYVTNPVPAALASICGDGMREATELCDDENDADGDGCTACEIDTGECAVAPASWVFWTCDGEPSRCWETRCDEGSSDPACAESTSLVLGTVTEGLVLPDETPGTIGSEPSGVACSCAETALAFECSASCTVDVGPCTSLTGAGTPTIAFERWTGGCVGVERCAIDEQPEPIVGVFASAASGIEREREFVAYPLTSPGLDLDLMAAGGGLVVAAGVISGGLDPETPAPLPGAPPAPFVLAVDEQLEVVWSRAVTAAEGGVFDLMSVAVDGAGNTVLAGGLYGTLELENGTVTVESPEHPDLQQIAIVAFSPAGDHLWSSLVPLPAPPAAPSPYQVTSARLAVADDGRFGLAAVVDTGLAGTPLHDLIAATILPEGAIVWVSRLRAGETPVPVIDVDPSVAVAIDGDGNVTVAGAVSGDGPFAWWMPEPTDPSTGERRFVVRLSPTGAQLSSDPLPPSDGFDVQMATDQTGRVTMLTASHLVARTADGDLRWVHELSPRPFDASSHATAPVRRLAVDAASGEIVLSTDASTAVQVVDSTEEHLLATVTSRASTEGEPLWTIRTDSYDDDGSGGVEVFLNRALAAVGDQVFVLGVRRRGGETRNDVAVLRRIVSDW